jgi:NTP pyrophosphatase (non-canonical NTP hydrolase)
MLKLKEGWVEIPVTHGDVFLSRDGEGIGEAFASYTEGLNDEPLDIQVYPNGNGTPVKLSTRELAHAHLLSVGSESPWEVVSDSATVNDLDEFQTLAMRTAGDNKDDRWLAEKMLGLAEEVGEVTGLVKKAEYHARAMDRDALRKELGDVMWYVAAIAEWYGFTLSEIATANIEKLRKRYPDGFSVERSLNRGEE